MPQYRHIHSKTPTPISPPEHSQSHLRVITCHNTDIFIQRPQHLTPTTSVCPPRIGTPQKSYCSTGKVSEHTVHHSLLRMELRNRRPVIVPMLTMVYLGRDGSRMHWARGRGQGWRRQCDALGNVLLGKAWVVGDLCGCDFDTYHLSSKNCGEL